MRIWSIHPQYLDTKGLIALWRETLLAQSVLLGKTKGYRNHPQLLRFKEQGCPPQAICNYLHAVCDEADRRTYKFQRSKIVADKKAIAPIEVSSGQVDYEWQHFLSKIANRDNKLLQELKDLQDIEPHPLFLIVDGKVASWERMTATKI